jgi:hypothetical protein
MLQASPHAYHFKRILSFGEGHRTATYGALDSCGEAGSADFATAYIEKMNPSLP